MTGRQRGRSRRSARSTLTRPVGHERISDAGGTRRDRRPAALLRTGDLGYLAGGELYVCGRLEGDDRARPAQNYRSARHRADACRQVSTPLRGAPVVAFGTTPVRRRPSASSWPIEAPAGADDVPELVRAGGDEPLQRGRGRGAGRPAANAAGTRPAGSRSGLAPARPLRARRARAMTARLPRAEMPISSTSSTPVGVGGQGRATAPTRSTSPSTRCSSPTQVVIDGRRPLMFGSNNYLGLTFDESAIEAGVAALRAWGTGTTGSRVANGTFAIHRDLEAALAAAFGKPHARIFTTGHQANLSMIAGLCGPGDTVLLDAESHASIFDAARLSGATTIVFRHNDVHDLAPQAGASAGRRDQPARRRRRPVFHVGRRRAARGHRRRQPGHRRLRARGRGALVRRVRRARARLPLRLEGVLDESRLHRRHVLEVARRRRRLLRVASRALRLLHFTARAYLFTASSSAATIARYARRSIGHQGP